MAAVRSRGGPRAAGHRARGTRVRSARPGDLRASGLARAPRPGRFGSRSGRPVVRRVGPSTRHSNASGSGSRTVPGSPWLPRPSILLRACPAGRDHRPHAGLPGQRPRRDGPSVPTPGSLPLHVLIDETGRVGAVRAGIRPSTLARLTQQAEAWLDALGRWARRGSPEEDSSRLRGHVHSQPERRAVRTSLVPSPPRSAPRPVKWY